MAPRHCSTDATMPESDEDDPEMPGLGCRNGDAVEAASVLRSLRDAFNSVGGDSTSMTNSQDNAAAGLQSLATAAPARESRIHVICSFKQFSHHYNPFARYKLLSQE